MYSASLLPCTTDHCTACVLQHLPSSRQKHLAVWQHLHQCW
jgi:hypothetical protein